MKKKYRSFKSARVFARSLNLRSYAQWCEICHIGEKPDDIPAAPHAYYKTEWNGWPDFLGSDFTNNKNRKFATYKEACKFVRSLNIKKYDEWIEWCKNNQRPNNIPYDLAKIYKKYWKGWGDFTGSNNISPEKKSFLPFIAAREYVRKQKIQSETAWREWCRSGKRPDNIPSAPARTYKGEWISWGDFLGTDFVSCNKRTYRTYEEAKAYVRTLNIKNLAQFRAWCKSEARPKDIPSSPEKSYKEWTTLNDFIGSGTVATKQRAYKPFNEAREFVAAQGIKNFIDWMQWCQGVNKPSNIPSCPQNVYKKEWKGWGYWLGIHNVWTKVAVVEFLKSLLPIIPSLTPAEILSIIQENGLINIKKSGNKNGNAHLIDDLISIATAPNNIKLIDKMTDKIMSEVTGNDEDENIDLTSDEDKSSKETSVELPTLSTTQILNSIDTIAELVRPNNSDTISFLITNAVNKIWRQFLENLDIESSLAEINSYKEGKYSSIVKKQFLHEYNEAINLPIPAGYSFKKNSKIILPNLMQRLVACKIRDERNYGNWSGVGAGKTLSAILASRVLNAKLTLIIALNSTLEGWMNEIRSAYPDSRIAFKQTPSSSNMESGHNYIILNYEAFQQKDSQERIQKILSHKIDFIVLDEIQSVKQRDSISSKRRLVVESLISTARETNPDLSVLGISATPVINSLNEATSLLSMITGSDFSEIETYPTVSNCLNIHKKLVLHGIRYIPPYNIAIDTVAIKICGKPLLTDLQNVKKREILNMEKILLTEKLNAIEKHLQPGVIIYTHYIQEIVGQIKEFVHSKGFSHAEFTGYNKTGLQPFIDNKADILIGSSTLGTGLDGLQKVCNKMIILALPWTYASYVQLLGRIYRQGSIYNKIQIIIPQVVLEHNGSEWSYDKHRMDRISFKKTLGDAVLDGIFPEEKLPAPNTMFAEAISALQKWIKNLEITSLDL